MSYLVVTVMLAVLAVPAAGSWLNNPDNNHEVRLAAGMGTFGVLAHTIQFGKDASGTKFDYVAEGGQNTLFPFSRMSAELHRSHGTQSSCSTSRLTSAPRPGSRKS
ncbi:hypothetical protein FJY70_02695 [candidate division WOR-3 bacterium]|nr:hypothetical protein [candidate division WOR-3 bacterium]